LNEAWKQQLQPKQDWQPQHAQSHVPFPLSLFCRFFYYYSSQQTLSLKILNCKYCKLEGALAILCQSSF
jgi:hypothetical protein